MTRPQIVRADTIDLQSRHAPSAQDHSRQPTHPAAVGAGPAAPHQAETLREVAAEANDEQHRSPRLSVDWHNEEGSHDSNPFADAGNPDEDVDEDLRAQLHNGLLLEHGLGQEDGDLADGEGDDDLDDDLLDKISSSPSIDDGGYPFSPMWPRRSDSLSPLSQPPRVSSLSEGSSERSPSPSVWIPVQLQSRSRMRISDPSVSLTSSFSLPSPLRSFQLPAHVRNDHLDVRDDFHIDECFGPSALKVDNTGHVLSVESGTEMDLAPESATQANGHAEYGTTDRYVHDTMMIPYESSEEDDDEKDIVISYTKDLHRVDSGWGGECLQESEDIDFEFVYALHTFVATVEGQANCTKGDTMVLLDDSNSYWWLVRVVKDSSIGYLPAEHIETPTERLARLNKHRNIDLSAAMLTDQAEKSKNPLKKAMRRRNAKTVTFAAPTYVEASDVDYSTDGDDEESEVVAKFRQAEGRQVEEKPIEIIAIEPLSHHQSVSSLGRPEDDRDASSLTATSEAALVSNDEPDVKAEAVLKSRNGTVRNTDSFFKDETAETRKITITPQMLRDDSTDAGRASTETKEIRHKSSLDKIEKEVAQEKFKDEKKKKEKKSGMLSGLFKRKEKKSKMAENDNDEELFSKSQLSQDAGTSPSPSKSLEDLVLVEGQTSQDRGLSPQRNTNKFQKQPQADNSTAERLARITNEQGGRIDTRKDVDSRPNSKSGIFEQSSQTSSAKGHEHLNASSDAASVPATDVGDRKGATVPRIGQPEPQASKSFSQMIRSRSSSNAEKEAKPEKVRKAKARVELDDFDNTPDTSPIAESAITNKEIKQITRPIPGAFPDSYMSVQPRVALVEPGVSNRLLRDDTPVSPIDISNMNPPPLVIDSSSQEEVPSPVSSTHSPKAPEAYVSEKHDDSRETDRSGSLSVSITPTWNDAQLRTFFDDDTSTKDLLLVVYDKSGVVPATSEHPYMSNLFMTENAKLADINSRLDNLLSDWLARKNKIATT